MVILSLQVCKVSSGSDILWCSTENRAAAAGFIAQIRQEADGILHSTSLGLLLSASCLALAEVLLGVGQGSTRFVYEQAWSLGQREVESCHPQDPHRGALQNQGPNRPESTPRVQVRKEGALRPNAFLQIKSLSPPALGLGTL